MKKLYFILLLSATTFFSCKKDGCRDSDAENFCSDCKDAGGCQFVGNLVFWYNQTTAQSVLAAGSTSFTYYVEGKLIGSSAASVYWTGSPNCGQNQSITAEVNLGSSRSKSVSYKVVDQDNDIIWQGSIELQGKTCMKLELTP